MDYPFENLSPEKFQEFCQALLVKEFADMQCFPVAQPDGGRDAIRRHMDTSKAFLMFQVKFVRNPSSIPDPRQWLLGIIKAEAPKVRRQIRKGAKRFILITNVAGTAHPGAGSIDKVDALLNQDLGLPSMCWWRNDLSRRLDNAWDLKWTYPELMAGPDLIRFVIEQGLSDNRERRTAALRAFVKDQFARDQDVKFRQVELQNRLLDLFIDVPIVPIHEHATKTDRRKIYEMQWVVARSSPQINVSLVRPDPVDTFEVHEERFWVRPEQRAEVGAATFLLHPLAQRTAPRLVLEGAPGQGKSTIVQYLCQVHRMRILERTDELHGLPEHHRSLPVRLPFKIDLRDLATWLAGKNPFSSETSDSPPVWWKRSLEAFLAAQVRHYSGGTEFNVDDLLAVTRLSAILIAFDGLDEIADIERRQEVVDEIVGGVNRLEENCASLQVVVTSRPAAFANSPGLPEGEFPHFQLDSVNRSLIEEYADKWLRARSLEERTAAEVKEILKEKLGQPHLRDLARNPMQLAILLSLIHTRGSSLPDKRTALYDSYVELFFNREAEKSQVVRDHRDLLINIHRFLAWQLHAAAEVGAASGAITRTDLEAVLVDYLSREGHDPTLAGQLFTGMVERVVAIVSRVEGTYEFEVQPLREYFAARYLYETAPYSPPGNERRGTKPDRFDAIARNFYWLNVTRFYAGCYSKGELASLINALQELVNDADYRIVSYPKNLAATLLGDWVFTQHPNSVKQVVALILDDEGLETFLASQGRPSRAASNVLSLPKHCGQDELVDRCFELLQRGIPFDYAKDVADLVSKNSEPDDRKNVWLKFLPSVAGVSRRRWLRYGLELRILHRLASDELDNVLWAQATERELGLQLAFDAGRFDWLEGDELRQRATVDAILNREMTLTVDSGINSVLGKFNTDLWGGKYAIGFREPVAEPLRLLDDRLSAPVDFAVTAKQQIQDSSELQKCLEFGSVAEVESQRPAEQWARDLVPWDTLVEKGRALWGDRWAFFHLANLSGAIRSPTETCKDCPDLLDHSKPLCRRARYGRLRAGTPTWWQEQLDHVGSGDEELFLVLLLWTWSSAATVVQCIERIDPLLQRLSGSSWRRLWRSVRESKRQARIWSRIGMGKDYVLRPQQLPQNLNARTVALVMQRATKNEKRELFVRYLADYAGSDHMVLSVCSHEAIDLALSRQVSWDAVLNLISHCHMQGVSVHLPVVPGGTRRVPVLSPEIARKVAGEPSRFPGSFVAAAIARCTALLTKKIVPVLEIAQRERWFDS